MYLLGRVSHSNEPVGDVSEVQVVAVALVSVLLLGHHGLDYTSHVAEEAGRSRRPVNRRGCCFTAGAAGQKGAGGGGCCSWCRQDYWCRH